MKTKYAVLGYVKSSLYYEKYDKFIFKNENDETIEIRINPFDIEISNDLDHNMDIQVTIILDAYSSLEAIVMAQSIAEKVVNLIAFSSGGRIEKCIFFKSISINTSNDVNEFCQLDFEILDNIAKKKVNIPNFFELLERLQNTKFDKERIERAIMFYQKGLSYKDILEKFNNYWISLECITPILNKIYPKVVEKRKCINCGYEEEIKNTIALKYFFEKELKCKDIYSKCRGIRTSIVHGLKNITDIEKDILDILEILEDCTYKIIVTLIESSIKKEYDISDEEEGMTFELHLEILNFKFSEEEKIIFPNISILMEFETDGDELLLRPNIKAPFLKSGIGIKSISWDYYGTCGQNIKKIQLKITN